MRVKKSEDGSLIIDREGQTFEQMVHSSVEDGRYVEAFALLHGWIDFLMWDVRLVKKSIGVRPEEQDARHKELRAFQNITFRDSLKAVQTENIITSKEALRMVLVRLREL
jgi:hypothetical protein